MSRRDRTGVGTFILAVFTIAIIAKQWEAACFTLLTVFAPYVAFVAPFTCREATRAGLRCRLLRWGWFFGCYHHRMDRIRRMRAAAPITASSFRTPRRPSHSAPHLTSSPAWASGASNGVMLVATVISAAAGVLALFQ